MTAGRKAGKRKASSGAPVPPGAYAPPPPPDAFGETSATISDQVETSSLSLHDLFAKQTTTLLKRADLDEEQKQAILIAMSCPCCGAGGLSITAKLKRRPSQKFAR
jgi:hypothetical protein